MAPVASFADPVAIETYTGTQTIVVGMPGTPSGGNVDFAGVMNFTTLTFTPGAITYGDTLIDFSGQEQAFLLAQYNIALSFPNSPGATVTAVGTWSVVDIGDGLLSWENVGLGSSFSSASFDLVLFSSFQSLVTDIEWNSTVIPELNGNLVSLDGAHTITGVDAANGILTVTASGTIFAEPIPTSVGPSASPRAVLMQNYPNPFNPGTIIRFSLQTDSRVILSVFDHRGRHVTTLVDGTLPPRVHEVSWRGQDSRGNHVGSGIYFCRLQVGEQALSRKLVLLK